MKIEDSVAVITGAASGIGRCVCLELARRGARALALADQSEAVDEVCRVLNSDYPGVATAFRGDVTDAAFRERVYAEIHRRHQMANICIPAAGITRDGLAVKVDKATDRVVTYPAELFRQVMEVNAVAPVYWALEMVAGIAEERRRRNLKRWEPTEPLQGAVIFIGSVSMLGNKGQIAYASAKAALEGAASTLMIEAIFHGVRCGIIHPGFTDTPMVRALGGDFIRDRILPNTQLRRLIDPAEIADAICFMIQNAAVSGSLWADAGWRPSPV
jgi:NAD(P)-dependent dehydrogenase (short-subunit alcohol dehydrogenase family)